MLVSTILVIALGTYFNLTSGLDAESENILYAAMAITMFLIDGHIKHIAFWTTFLVLLALKSMAHIQQDLPFDVQFTFIVLNNTALGLILYLSLQVFKSVLVKAFERSEQHEQRLYSLIDNVPIYMALANVKGTYLLSNERYAENFGLKKKEIVGRKRESVLPEHVYEVQEPLFEKAKKGETVSFLKETVLNGGKTISANGQYVPILDSNGKVEAVTISVDDVTELVKIQKELKASDETKNKLFSIIAHDIRSPLNLFQSLLNLNIDGVISKKDFLDYQKGLKSRLDSLSITVDELLDWARMQLGGIKAFPTTVYVQKLVHDNVEVFDALIKKKQLKIDVDVSDDITAWIDENHFKIAIRNLLHNAIKFTQDFGLIKVVAAQRQDAISFSIKDDGVGMTKDTIASILKKNVQKPTIGTAQEKGSGLGLSLSLGLLENNNCTINIHSELGQGTMVEVWVPVGKK